MSSRILAAAAVLAAAPAVAGPISIGPLRLDLGPRARVASVTIGNRGAEPMNFQAQVVAWTQKDGQDGQAATDDVLVSPPISVIPAGRSQIFRVALRHSLPPQGERAYRVVLSDVTPPPPPGSGPPQISFRISHSVPLYVQTIPGGKPSLAVAACVAPDPKTVCVRVDNSGSLHTLVKRVVFHSGAWTATITPNAVVLSGGERPFAVARPADLPAKASVTATVEAEGASASGSVGGG